MRSMLSQHRAVRIITLILIFLFKLFFFSNWGTWVSSLGMILKGNSLLNYLLRDNLKGKLNYAPVLTHLVQKYCNFRKEGYAGLDSYFIIFLISSDSFFSITFNITFTVFFQF